MAWNGSIAHPSELQYTDSKQDKHISSPTTVLAYTLKSNQTLVTC